MSRPLASSISARAGPMPFTYLSGVEVSKDEACCASASVQWARYRNSARYQRAYDSLGEIWVDGK